MQETQQQKQQQKQGGGVVPLVPNHGSFKEKIAHVAEQLGMNGPLARNLNAVAAKARLDLDLPTSMSARDVIETAVADLPSPAAAQTIARGGQDSGALLLEEEEEEEEDAPKKKRRTKRLAARMQPSRLQVCTACVYVGDAQPSS